MSRRRKSFSPNKALLNNGIYKKNGKHRPPKKIIFKANAKQNSEAGKAITNGQKEAKIRQLMKDKGLTYAQAAIELMN